MTDVPMTSAEAIADLRAPNNRKFKIEPFESNPALYQIKYADDKRGEMPEDFQNHLFTKRTLGEEWLKRYLAKLWEHALKNAGRSKAA